MNLLRLSSTAQAYYEGLRAPSLVQGWEKYVVTDGTQCMIVRSDYQPEPGAAVFYIVTRNGKTSVQPYKYNDKEK